MFPPKDILIIIALKLDLKSVYNFSLCNKNIYKVIWNNRNFWNVKTKREFDLIFPEKYQKIGYQILCEKNPQTGLNIASSKGYKILVEYYLTNYKYLNLAEAFYLAIKNHRKNIVKLFNKEKIIIPSTFYAVTLK